MPFVVVACTALFRQPFRKQLYATKLRKLHTQKKCTLKPRASVTRISAGTLSPNFTNITSPTTSFSAVTLCFSPSLRTVASCEWNILFPWTLHHVLKGSELTARKKFLCSPQRRGQLQTTVPRRWRSRFCFLVGTQIFSMSNTSMW